jgi:uncharacterized membrane protein YfcA
LIDTVLQLTGLPLQDLLIATIAVLAAGLIRGFAGFGLSAMLMASIVTIIPPVSLIPICFILEGVAGVAMLKGGIKNANMTLVWSLAIGSAIGAPIGLYATISIDVGSSKLIALFVILSLTIASLFKFRPKFLATKAGLYGSGLTAGVVTGLASVGGMVVALYILASNADVKKVRASLVMFLLMGMFTSLIYLFAYDMMTMEAFWRGLVLSPFILLGVFLGSLLFRPAYEHLYKRVCLLLLGSLCAIGLARLML